MAQPGEHPPFDEQDARFDLGFVAGLADPGRDHRHAIVVGKCGVARVQLGFSSGS